MPYVDKRNRKAYVKAYMKDARERARKIIVAAKDVPCADCGGCWPACVMHFHHIEEKQFGIAKFVSKMSGSEQSFDKLRKEIKRCEVLCANCHALRHNMVYVD